ncbi:MAG TPA: acyl-CoA dehydrogenase family protein [Acidimicrobiales bacterium]|nr:acyl-CoA dehydrogenase family protein [Acidimicrobiales bacterium]
MSELEIRAEVRTWLQEHLPPAWVKAVEDDDEDALREAQQGVDQRELLRAIGSAGWAQPTWEVAHGGKGLGPEEAAVVEEEKNRHRVPRSFDVLGLGLAAPTIREYGTDEQKAFYLTRMAQGERWCQLFSEPGNGSDVAGLATRAERDGDEWVVNGQKVWTSGAHVSQWGMLIARSHPDQPKHKGITYFLLDMSSPGIEVRPLRQITGDAEFNEVFLSDVRIPDSARLGPEGGGWAVAQTTLMNERVALSGAFGGGGGAGAPARRSGGDPTLRRPRTGADEVIARARANGAWDDPAGRDRLVKLWVEGKLSVSNMQRAIAVRRTGGQPGPEGSIGKLFSTTFNMRLQVASVDVMGMESTAWPADDAGAALRVRTFLRSRGNSIEGGTSEIQKNILGDRVLGLPREPDASKDLPWKDVPRN